MVISDLKKRKILIFSFDYRNIFENNFHELMEKLNRDRMNPEINDLFILAWSSKKYHKKNGNIETIHLKAPCPKIRLIEDVILVFVAPFLLLRKKFIPDYIVIRDFPFAWPALIVKCFFKSKIVFFLGSMPTKLAETRKYGYFRKMYQAVPQFFSKTIVDIFIANGLATKKYLTDMRVAESRISVMTEDVLNRDMHLITTADPGYLRSKYSIPEHKKILLSVGRLVDEKAFDKLLLYFSKINRNDLILVIAGEGDRKNDLVKLIDNLSISDKVIFTGQIDRAHIWSFYASADLFILLSLSEGNPTVFREAMYMKLPVIGSKIDPILEFIGDDGERGYVWSENDGIAELEEKINLCLDSNRSSEMVHKAYSFICNDLGFHRTINDYLL